MTRSSLTVNRHLAVFAPTSFTKSRCLKEDVFNMGWWNIEYISRIINSRGKKQLLFKSIYLFYVHNSTVNIITRFNTTLLILEIITFLQKNSDPIASYSCAYSEAFAPAVTEILKVIKRLQHSVVLSFLTKSLCWYSFYSPKCTSSLERLDRFLSIDMVLSERKERQQSNN